MTAATTWGMDTAASRWTTSFAGPLDAALLSFDWYGADAEPARERPVVTDAPSQDQTALLLESLSAQACRESEARHAGGGSGSSTPATQAASLGFCAHAGETLGAWLDTRIDSALTATATPGHAGDFLGTLSAVLLGAEDRSVAEIAASVLASVDPDHAVSTVDTVESTATATDAHPRPTDLPGLMRCVAAGSLGEARITRIDNGTGVATYVVGVPATGSGLVGHDLRSAAESVRRIVEAADLPTGSPVLLVGHGRGGIVAACLASDQRFVERHGVTHVLTSGAPTDHLRLAPGVLALQVQHRFDLAPRLGLTDDRTGSDDWQTVTLDDPGSIWDLAASHSPTEYRDSVRDALAGTGADRRVLRDFESMLSPFLVTPEGSATAVDVPAGRGR